MIRVLYIGDPSSVHDIKWVSYFSTRDDFESFFLVQDHEMHLITAARKEQFDKLGITIVGPIKSYSLWRFWENKASYSKINQIIDEHKIDIVHPLFATPFSLWTRNLPVPSIITSRGSDIHVVLAGLGKGNLLHQIHGKLLLQKFKEAFTNANVLSCTSAGQLTKINTVLGTQLTGEIIRTGVNVDEIDKLKPNVQLAEKLNGKRIIFLPRYIRPIYQTELQIDALSKLNPDLKQNLAIVLIQGVRTDEKYSSIVEARLEKCGIAHHTFESLTQHEMWSLFKLSALTIMTPKTDGTPNSALEAMAAECPLILGSFDYDGDLFSEDVCHRMKTESSDELVELIESALDNYPEEKLERAFKTVSEKGNRLVEMDRLKRVYESLVKA